MYIVFKEKKCTCPAPNVYSKKNCPATNVSIYISLNYNKLLRVKNNFR